MKTGWTPNYATQLAGNNWSFYWSPSISNITYRILDCISSPTFHESDRTNGRIKSWMERSKAGDGCTYMGHGFVVYEHESNEYKKSRFLLLSRNPQLNDVMWPFHYNHRPTLESWVHNIDQYTRILGLRSMQHTRIDANLLRQDSTNITFIAPSELTTTEVLPSWDTTSQEWIRGPELFSSTHHALTQEKIFSTICFLNLWE